MPIRSTAGRAVSVVVLLAAAVLLDAKTEAGESDLVDTEHGKVASMSFKADGVDYFWEPTPTGGAPDPVLVKDGKTYTVTGKIKQLRDYTQLSDFIFKAQCPG